jgi:hypothetical protein
MASLSVRERVGTGVGQRRVPSRGVVGSAPAFAATAVVLLVLFGWTYVVNPDRVAPTKDPAYYTWRTEALLSEDPSVLLEIRGAFDMFAGGYRVVAPALGGFLRRIPAMSSLHTTAFLMVVVPVVTALLLAGFAYRRRRDPLLWHSVAFGSASLYLTPPFVGYLDNILCLLFLAGAIWFIGPARRSWPARGGLFALLLASGFTHPTTLVIFCGVLGAMAAARLAFRGWNVRSVLADDGPALATAAAAALATYAVWRLGPWGVSASLSEAALPPPYGVDFFLERLGWWLDALRPSLNGPLFAIGAVALFAAGRRWVEDDLARVSIVWLLPLAGVFGFVAGIAYPYYRFFNTTLGWVLLVGVGGWVVMLFFLAAGRRPGLRWIAPLGVAAVAAIFATNLAAGFDQANWNDPDKGWMSAATRSDLDALRAALAGNRRPVVFVIDEGEPSFQTWGFTKLSGNTSRYGLPHGQIDHGYMYLGSLENFLSATPTRAGDPTYDDLSRALLDDARAGIDRWGRPPIAVVARAFNTSGSNAELAAGAAGMPDEAARSGADVWIVRDGRVEGPSGAQRPAAATGHEAGIVHLGRHLAGLALLLLPGVLLFRAMVPTGGLPEALGMAPALSLVWLPLVAIVVLAVARAPFSATLAWLTLVVATASAALMAARRSFAQA